MRLSRLVVVASLLLDALPRATLAQAFPDHPVTLLVPAAAAGPTDTVARVIADRMSDYLGQSVLVENNGGAGGYLAAAQIARARPDGYSLLYATAATYLVLPHIYRSKGFEPFAQFRPVASVAKVASGFFVNKDLPVRTLAEFVAHAKASPKPLNYGSPGVGSNNHLAVERFRKIAGFEATHVPFRGGAPVMAALLAGEIQFAFDAQSTLVPYFKSDSVRVLAFADEARSPFLPGVPTFDESGYPGLYQRSWHTIVAPAGAPDDVVEKLRAAAQRATEGPTARERLTAMQTDPFYHPAAEFEAMARKEYAEAAPSVEAAGLSAE